MVIKLCKNCPYPEKLKFTYDLYILPNLVLFADFMSIGQNWNTYDSLPNYLLMIFLPFSTVDCQLGPWTPCNSDCGFAGKTRLFGKMPNQMGVKCSQGDTWQKCENLPPCPGDHIIYKT